MAEAVTGKKVSFKALVIINVALMAAMAVYMCFVIITVPKTPENSKAGLFAELVDDLMALREAPLRPTTRDEALPAINARLLHYVPQGGLEIAPLHDWRLLDWQESSVHGRPLLTLRLADVQGRELMLGLFALAKRHFPKTGGFSHKDAWFFTYGKDHDVAQIPAHKAELDQLRKKGLNLVVTNYGNDYFLLMLSPMDSRELAEKLFSLTTIYQTAP